MAVSLYVLLLVVYFAARRVSYAENSYTFRVIDFCLT